MRSLRALAVLSMLLNLVAGSATAQRSPIWSGHDQAWRVDWTTDDITATRVADGKRVFSMRSFAAAQLDLSMRQETSAAGTLERTRKISVVSLFGPLLALRDDTLDDFRPSAHPSERVRFWTIDLGAPAIDGFDPSDQFGAALGAGERGRIRSLDQIASTQAIADALARDKVVQGDLPHPPHDLDDLLTSWRDEAGNAVGSVSPEGPAGGTHCHDVPEDALTSFAIVGRTDKSIAVRLGLPGSGACHAEFTQLGLILPLSVGLAQTVGEGAIVIPPAGLPPLRITETRRLR